jgi:hypothetical protein
VKTWDEARIAKGSLASTCGHDPAFVRIGVGTFALRAITHHPEVGLQSIARTVDLLCANYSAQMLSLEPASHAEVFLHFATENSRHTLEPAMTLAKDVDT